MSTNAVIQTERSVVNRKADRFRWTTLIVQSIVGISTSFIFLTNIWIGPLHETHGWDLAVIALTFTLIPLVGLPASIIAGKFRDRYGSKMALRVGAVGYAASIAASTIDASVWFFVIGMGVFATFFMYFAYLAMMANIGELFPDKRGLALGILIAATNVGGALIAPIAEVLVRTMGVSMSIVVQGAAYGAVMFLCSFLIVEAPAEYTPRGWMAPQVEGTDKAATATATMDQIDRDLPWYRLLVSTSFWLFFVGMALVTVGLMGFTANMSLIAADTYGVDSATGAWFYTVYALGMGAGALAIGFLSDRVGPLTVIGAASALVSIALFVLLLEGLHSPALFLAVIVVAGVVFGGAQSVIPNVLMTAFGSKNFGVNFGLMAFSGAVAAFIGTQLAVAVDAHTLFTVGVITGSLGCCAAFLTRIAINRKFRYKIIR